MRRRYISWLGTMFTNQRLTYVEISCPGRFFWPVGLSYSRANAVEPEKNVTFEHSGASSVCTTPVSAYTRGPLTNSAQRHSPAAVGTRELKLSFATSRFLCALDAGLWRVCECVEPTHDARGRVVAVALDLVCFGARRDFFFVSNRLHVYARLCTTPFS
jgi:hypothetical protein